MPVHVPVSSMQQFTHSLVIQYMIMEYVREGPLDKILMLYGASLKTRFKLAMCEQICSAMAELSGENVVHRDLAVRNILVADMDPVHVKVRYEMRNCISQGEEPIYVQCCTGFRLWYGQRFRQPHGYDDQ